jgi:bifunctional non-homologous end joining protein LigD
MLAVPWPGPFSDPAWIFEPKWDGIRALVGWEGSSVVVRNRRGVDVTDRYPELSALGASGRGVLDGELVVLGPGGVPSFERLQRRIHLSGPRAVAQAAGEAPVTFVAFDLLHHGEPLVELGVEDRRARLEDLDLAPPAVVGSAVAEAGDALWAAVTERALEGMVAKRLGSPYRSGVRSSEWRKIPHIRTLRAVVGGFTPGERGRHETFGALLLGLWEGDRLRWIGNVGTGFSDAELAAVREALDAMRRSDPPFHEPRSLPSGALWVEPELVALVGYREWTAAGRIRQPRFRGFGDELSADITWEAEGPSAS